MLKNTTLTLPVFLMIVSCGFPPATNDYLEKLEKLAIKIEQLSQQSTICQSDVDQIERRYGHLAPGKNTYVEFEFSDQQAAQFQQLIKRIETANRDIVSKGNPNC